MNNQGFQMKRFYVRHDRSSMRVGTDGVLLGAWCPLSVETGGRKRTEQVWGGEMNMHETYSVLDVGTGCGLIALMVAQRLEERIAATDAEDASDWRVDAIDIDPPSVEQAAENFVLSPWSGHLHAYERDVCDWEGEYDLIVSNPPFFNSSLVCPDARRARARQAGVALPFGRLAEATARLLKPDGRLAIILPVNEEEEMVRCAKRKGISVNERCVVKSKPEGKPIRVMLLLGRISCLVRESRLVLYASDSSRSEDYTRLTKNFYL